MSWKPRLNRVRMSWTTTGECKYRYWSESSLTVTRVPTTISLSASSLWYSQRGREFDECCLWAQLWRRKGGRGRSRNPHFILSDRYKLDPIITFLFLSHRVKTILLGKHQISRRRFLWYWFQVWKGKWLTKEATSPAKECGECPTTRTLFQGKRANLSSS